MKKVFLNGLVIAALVVTADAVASCKSKGGGEAGAAASGMKLLERMVSDDGTELRFEYDSKNRLIKKHEYRDGELDETVTVTYNDHDNSVVAVREYIKNPQREKSVTNFVVNRDTITYHDGKFMITLNDDGYISEEFGDNGTGGMYRSAACEYQGGNVISKTWTGVCTYIYEYDDKMSPFRNAASPRWLMQHLGLSGLYNNIVREYSDDLPWYEKNDRTYQYEYDSDGFPTKRICQEEYQDDPDADSPSVRLITTHYVYRGGASGETLTEETASFSIDPQFDIYGTWQYVVTASSFSEWRVAPPNITINPDNTVSALIYESRYGGTISKTDTHQLRVRILSLWAEGDQYPVEEGTEWVLTYDPATNLLEYGGNNFRKKNR